jgi:hypothetical protein
MSLSMTFPLRIREATSDEYPEHAEPYTVQAPSAMLN